MIRALYSAASGMTAQQLNIDNIANNLANANTVGFKSRRAQFQDLMYQSMVQPGAQAGSSTVVPTKVPRMRSAIAFSGTNACASSTSRPASSR